MGRLAKGANPVYARRSAIVNRARDLGLNLKQIALYCGKRHDYMTQLLNHKMQVPQPVEVKLMSVLQIPSEDWGLFFCRKHSMNGERKEFVELATK